MRKNYKYDFKTDKPKKVDTYVPLDMRCLSSGYFSDAEKLELREDIIGPEAEKLAKIMASLEPELTSTQLRKFFNEVKDFYGFVKFFESVVGYFYYYNEENKRQGSK